MKRAAMTGGLVLVLGLVWGCSDGGQMMEQTTRNAAKSAVTQVIARQFPGVDVAPFTDCIIDNATADELLGLAGGAITGPDAATTQIVVGIAERPQTVQCLAAGAAGNLLG